MKPRLIRHLGEPRQTFSSLRASRSAVRLARSILFHRGIDIHHVRCEWCGENVDCSKNDGLPMIECPRCGICLGVPEHLRGGRKAEPDEELPDAPPQAEPDPDETFDSVIVALVIGAILLVGIVLMASR